MIRPLLIALAATTGISLPGNASEDRSLALVPCEIAALRDLLWHEKEGSLQALSEAGKKVLSDRMNAVVTIQPDGAWHWRHFGSKVDLFAEAGAPEDYTAVVSAMAGRKYKEMTRDGICLTPDDLFATLMSPGGPDRVRSAHQELKSRGVLSQALVDVLATRIGEAASRLPPFYRDDILSDNEHGEFYKNLALGAERLHHARIQVLEEGKAALGQDPEVAQTLAFLLEQIGRHPGIEDTPNGGVKKALGTKKNIYVYDGIVRAPVYIEVSPVVKKSPSEIIKQGSLVGLMNQKKFSVYYAPTDSQALIKLDNQVLVKSLARKGDF